jgi:hypothetical protein
MGVAGWSEKASQNKGRHGHDLVRTARAVGTSFGD